MCRVVQPVPSAIEKRSILLHKTRRFDKNEEAEAEALLKYAFQMTRLLGTAVNYMLFILVTMIQLMNTAATLYNELSFLNLIITI